MGYDAGFTALMPAALEVHPKGNCRRRCVGATGVDRQIAVAPARGDAPGTLDLNKLFIEPHHIRRGVGRALLVHAVTEAQQCGAERLTILADRTQRASTNATARCEAARRLRTRCPAACCRSTRSG